MQVIGIGKLHLAADIFQVCGAERPLNGPLGAYIHKNGSLHHAMGTGKYTPAGLPFCFQKLKHNEFSCWMIR